jgi:hypothetical protein
MQQSPCILLSLPCCEIFEVHLKDTDVGRLPANVLHRGSISSAIRVEHAVANTPVLEVDLAARAVDENILWSDHVE